MEEFNHKHYNYKFTKGFGIAILIFLVLLVGSAYAQVVSGSVNTPSGYSLDVTTGNMIPYDSSIKTSTGWDVSGLQGSFVNDGYTFSYATSTLTTNVNLANLSHGYQNTGAIFVTGFSYGFKYRFQCANSIGGSCDNTSGPQDNLSATASYLNQSGVTEWSHLHQLGLQNINDGNSSYNPNWQQLSNTHTFSGAKPLTTIGSFRLSITGSDAGFWACLGSECYGPQVKDAFLNVNYSVDPCVLNPAYSPSCPGFNTVLQGAQSPLLWYSYDIASRLPHIGGGVQVHGFDYGFGYYAGDYCTNTFMFWCTSSSGANGGTINMRITDKNNIELFKDSIYREGNYSGGSYSNRFLFTESQNSLNLGQIQWYATGVWGDNFQWSAYTRPIWSPDPCYEQPLYSKNCSNFDAEIKRLADIENDRQQAALASVVANVTSTSVTPNSTVTTTINDANTSNPTVNVTTNPLPPPDRPPEETTSPRPPPPPPTSIATAAPREEVRLDTPRQETRDTAPRTTARIETTSDNTSLALSIVRQNQQRESDISSRASQNAIQTASIAATTSIRQAENIALEAVTRSQNNIQQQEQSASMDLPVSVSKTEQLLNMSPAPGSTSVVNIAIQQRNTQAQTTNEMPQQSFNNSSTAAIVQFNAMSVSTAPVNMVTAPVPQAVQPIVQPVQMFNPLQPPVFTQVQPTNNTVYVQPTSQQTTENKVAENIQQQEQQVNSVASVVTILQQPQQPLPEQQTVIQQSIIAPVITVDIPTSQTNFTTDKTNPINEIIDNKPVMVDSDKKETNTQTVRQNVQDNDAAAGVSIDTIARTPVGFNSYMVALTDANFYAPKEIYRNQRTVDNARALRQLASDRLHQQMVDQQYLPR